MLGSKFSTRGLPSSKASRTQMKSWKTRRRVGLAVGLPFWSDR